MLQNREMLALYVLDPTPTRWLAKYLVLKEGYSSMLLCTNLITLNNEHIVFPPPAVSYHDRADEEAG